jgi:2-oxoglutarate ferredoxin oxidoreductase subunit beta
MQKVFAETGRKREDFAVISGIGCSSRFPYYMNTYGFHTIHGRAPTIATGVKAANPNLSVWIMTGDGDALSIGGNHILHILRRNVNVNIILFNNRIYGLTKGQYSPTSALGKKTKTSPMGSIDNPINPLCIALASEATFVARTIDTAPKHMAEVFKAAYEHNGTSFVEVFQNCKVFNDNTFEDIAGREFRDDRLIDLEHNKPLIFGKNKQFGIRSNNLNLEVVNIEENNIAPDDLLHHDAYRNDPSYAYLLTQMNFPEFPVPMGVFRKVDKPAYDKLLNQQIKEAISKEGEYSMENILRGHDYWLVKDEDTSMIDPEVTGKGRDSISDELKIMKDLVKDEDQKKRDPFAVGLNTKLEDILESYGMQDIYTVSPYDNITTVIAKMKEAKNLNLPVVENGRLEGMVTARDIVQKVLNKSMDRNAIPAKKIMTVFLQPLNGSNLVSEAIHALRRDGFRFIPVQSNKGYLVMLSLKGLIRFLHDKYLDYKK